MTKLLFMDEKYIDQKASVKGQITSLTGMLVEMESHRHFRKKFYSLVCDAINDPPGTVSSMPEIHAMALFPGKSDSVKFDFLENLVGILVDLEFKIYRIGYRKNKLLTKIQKNETTVLGLCFQSILFLIDEELKSSTVWPVMERDGSTDQDKAFAGLIQQIDYFSERIRPEFVSVNNTNLGELLYSTKKSAYGSAVDCVSYLLHAQFLRDLGQELTPFKLRLATIADKLHPAIKYNESIDLALGPPPETHFNTGPIRYLRELEKKD